LFSGKQIHSNKFIETAIFTSPCSRALFDSDS